MTQYDTREIIARLVDASEMDEFKAQLRQTLVTGFAHIEGLAGRRSSPTTASSIPRRR